MSSGFNKKISSIINFAKKILHPKAKTSFRDQKTKPLSNDDIYDHYLNMGLSLYKQNEPEEAIKAFQKCVASTPDKDSRICYMIGRSFYKQNKLDKALENYYKSIELNSDNAARIYYDIGIALYRQNKLDQAIASHTKSLELNGKFKH